jgi:hypothetical protein
MLNNPDVQPNATINRWIAAILLFDFKLVHIPAEKHHGPDGLSRRKPADDEVDEDDDPEDWIDRTLALGIWVVSWLDSATTDNSTAVWTLDAPDAPPPQRSTRLRSKANADNRNSNANSYDNSSRPSQEHATDNLLPSDDPSDDNNATADDQGDTSASSPFPPNATAAKTEDELLLIHEYLQRPRAPAHLHSEALTRFFRRATRFTLANDRLWRLQHDGRHQLYVAPPLRLSLIRDTHDHLGHKGHYSTRRTLADRFWWPSLDSDVKWYVEMCHQCQLRQTTQTRLPPTVDSPAPLFRKVYIDTMFMPHASGFRYIVQARCSLTAWPEWCALRVETGRTLGSFIFEDILCRWGAVGEIVTDNGTTYVAALDWLSSRYGI